MGLVIKALAEILEQSGFMGLTTGNVIMLVVACILLYLAIGKGFEPLLLVPIATGCLLVNLPLSGIMDQGGFLRYIFYGTEHEIYPVIIFMGIGALTDFSPLLANPLTFLLGAAAQLGVFVALFGAMMIGFSVPEAASIGIIGGADGLSLIHI